MSEQSTAHAYPELTDPNITVDPAAARLLVNDQHALGVAISGDVLLVAVDAHPSPARFAELEAATGMALTIAVAAPQLLAHLRARAVVPAAGQPGVLLAAVLNDAAASGASDVLLHTGRRPVVRAAGQLHTLSGYAHLAATDVLAAAAWFTGGRDSKTVTAAGSRWRTAASTSGGRPFLSLRRLPAGPVRAEELHLPAALAAAAAARHGLVIIASPHGGGRTTTAAGVVDLINATRPVHVVTIASPVEYRHQPRQAVVTALEVGTDTPTAASGVLDAGRLGADVIELDVRTPDDARAAIAAAVAGHLVIATVPAVSAESAVRHLTGLIPAAERAWALQAVASTLRVVTAQQLLPTTAGAPGAVFESLAVNEPVRTAIRDDRLGNLVALLEDGASDTTSSMDRTLALNVAAGRLHLGTARQAARDTELLDQYLAHTVTNASATPLGPAQPAAPVQAPLTPAAAPRPTVAPTAQRPPAPAPAQRASAPAHPVPAQQVPQQEAPSPAATGRRAAPAPSSGAAANAPSGPAPEAPRRATLRRQ